MKTETYKGVIESAYGQPLATALKFNGSFDSFTLPDTAKDTAITLVTPDGADAITDAVTFGDIYSLVNNKRKANARQKSMQAALDAAGINKPVVDATPEGLQVAARQMVKMLVATGKSEADATQLAEATLGVKIS